MGYGKTNQSPIQIDNPGLDQINQTINEQGQTLNTQGQTITSQGQSIQTNAANITTNTTNIASNTAQLADIASLTPTPIQPELDLTTSGSGIFNGNINSSLHGVNVNTPNLTNLSILKSTIFGSHYGVLLNTNSDGGKGLLIAFNDITSDTSDAIELNNPSTTPFNNVRVIGNKLKANTNGTGNTAGFALGIAKTRNVSAVGNISELSRNEGLHIEDDQENIVVVGNVFDQCTTDGAHILNHVNAHPVILNGNHFVQANLSKTGNGIWRVYDSSGSLDLTATNNRVRGFNTGLYIDGKSYANIEGSIVEDCLIAIKTGVSSYIRGTIYAINTPTLVQGQSGSIIDKVISKTTPTTILQYYGTPGQEGATLKGFASKVTYTPISGVQNIINLFALPSLMQGKVKVYKTGSDKIYCVADINWDGATLTVTILLKKTGGIMGSTVNLINNSGNLALQISNIAGTSAFDLFYDFDGIYYQE